MELEGKMGSSTLGMSNLVSAGFGHALGTVGAVAERTFTRNASAAELLSRPALRVRFSYELPDEIRGGEALSFGKLANKPELFVGEQDMHLVHARGHVSMMYMVTAARATRRAL
jgi:hypothetical protein